MVGDQINSFKTIKSESIQSIPGLFSMTSTNEVKGKSWNILSFMGGAHSFLPFDGSLFSLGARAMIGLAVVNTPKITETITLDMNGVDIPDELNMRGSTPMEAAGTSASGFAYSFGIGAKYDILDKFCLLLNADYFGTSINFNPTVALSITDLFGMSDIYGGSSVDQLTASTKMNINSISITVGFGIKF